MITISKCRSDVVNYLTGPPALFECLKVSPTTRLSPHYILICNQLKATSSSAWNSAHVVVVIVVVVVVFINKSSRSFLKFKADVNEGWSQCERVEMLPSYQPYFCHGDLDLFLKSTREEPRRSKPCHAETFAQVLGINVFEWNPLVRLEIIFSPLSLYDTSLSATLSSDPRKRDVDGTSSCPYLDCLVCGHEIGYRFRSFPRLAGVLRPLIHPGWQAVNSIPHLQLITNWLPSFLDTFLWNVCVTCALLTRNSEECTVQIAINWELVN